MAPTSHYQSRKMVWLTSKVLILSLEEDPKTPYMRADYNDPQGSTPLSICLWPFHKGSGPT